MLFDIELTLISTNGAGRGGDQPGVHGADQAHHDIPRGSRPPTERYGEPVEKACGVSSSQDSSALAASRSLGSGRSSAMAHRPNPTKHPRMVIAIVKFVAARGN